MRQGEVWRLPNGVRVLVASNDAFNATGLDPLCVPLVRRRGPESDFVVFTGEQDHVAGMLLLPETGPQPLDGGASEALISGPTMAAVSRKLAELFAH